MVGRGVVVLEAHGGQVETGGRPAADLNAASCAAGMRQCQWTDGGESSTTERTVGSALPDSTPKAVALVRPLYSDFLRSPRLARVAGSTWPSVSVTFHQGEIMNWILSR